MPIVLEVGHLCVFFIQVLDKTNVKRDLAFCFVGRCRWPFPHKALAV